MTFNVFITLSRILLIAGVGGTGFVAQAQAIDVPAAEALIAKSKCGQCHSVDKKKDGPSFKVTAAKYKGKPEAEATLYKHLTTGPKVKVDGVEEEHRIVKSTDEAEVKNLVRFILSR